jgi:hypothetical protein
MLHGRAYSGTGPTKMTDQESPACKRRKYVTCTCSQMSYIRCGSCTRLSKCKHALRGSSAIFINGNTSLGLHFRATVAVQGGFLTTAPYLLAATISAFFDARVTRKVL